MYSTGSISGRMGSIGPKPKIATKPDSVSTIAPSTSGQRH
jgi:hypothetical protein